MVGAIGTGADGAAEMLAELGMVVTDPGYRLANRPGHAGSSTLRGGGCSSIATAQAKCAREFSDQEVAFGVGLGGPLCVTDGVRLIDVIFDLGQASAVGVLRSSVEDLTRVAECRVRQVAGVPAVQLCTVTALGGDEIEHVILPAGIGEEPC